MMADERVYNLRGLDPTFWKAVKVAAAREGISIKELILRALRKYLTQG